jgi:formylglycine-generating enzyme required for sulfatase activity
MKAKKNTEYRMLRGGSCYNVSDYQRVAERNWDEHEDPYWSVGFRFVIRRKA